MGKVKCMDYLAKDPMVLTAEIDRCAYGLIVEDAECEAPAKKPTRLLTDGTALQQALSMKCQGCIRHVQSVEAEPRQLGSTPGAYAAW